MNRERPAVGDGVRICDLPVKLLRSFCSQMKYGIKYLSTMTKKHLVASVERVDPKALEKFSAWLKERNQARNEHWYIERHSWGRRITCERVRDGQIVYQRIFEESVDSMDGQAVGAA